MTNPDSTVDSAVQHARAVWLLGLLAKRMDPRPDGTAVLELPARYVAALATYGPQDTTPPPEPGHLYLAWCGSSNCPHDVWDTTVHGEPCPVCGNTDGNGYEPIGWGTSGVV